MAEEFTPADIVRIAPLPTLDRPPNAPAETKGAGKAKLPPIVAGDGSRIALSAPAGSKIGYPWQGSHAQGDQYENWESDNAYDVSLWPGTAIVAPMDGIVSARFGWGKLAGSGRLQGWRLHTEHHGGPVCIYYAHMLELAKHPGEPVKAGEVVGWSGVANGVAHLHVAFYCSSYPSRSSCIDGAPWVSRCFNVGVRRNVTGFVGIPPAPNAAPNTGGSTGGSGAPHTAPQQPPGTGGNIGGEARVRAIIAEPSASAAFGWKKLVEFMGQDLPEYANLIGAARRRYRNAGQ